MQKWTLVVLSFLLYTCAEPTYETIDGILQVPENRENPNSRTLNLVYKVLKAKEPDSLKSPIVFLQGGPGGATLIMEEYWKNNPLRNNRDIVLMDQRGTGESEANCPEISSSLFAVMRQDLSIADDIIATNRILNECKETMKTDGVDLAGYNSRENAADFEDLRKVLGYKKWNLFGGSYGSRLGLTIMRDFPNGVRSAVLAAILPPEANYFNDFNQNFENSLFEVLDRCSKNQECNQRFPNMKERFVNVLKKLQATPIQFDYKGKPFVLNTHDAYLLFFVSLYDRSYIANLPLLIEAMEKGEIELIINTLKAFDNFYNLINQPMNLSVMAYEELPFNDFNAIARSVNDSEIGFVYPPDIGKDLLNNWHSFRATDFEDQPVISDIPTLMTSGNLDHVTPTKYAKAAIKHLKNGYELIFEDEAHSHYNDCFFEIAEEFLNDPLIKPNMKCSLERNSIKWNLSKPDSSKN